MALHLVMQTVWMSDYHLDVDWALHLVSYLDADLVYRLDVGLAYLMDDH